MSSTTTSGLCSRALRTPSAALPASSSTVMASSASSNNRRPERTSAWSSTIRHANHDNGTSTMKVATRRHYRRARVGGAAAERRDALGVRRFLEGLKFLFWRSAAATGAQQRIEAARRRSPARPSASLNPLAVAPSVLWLGGNFWPNSCPSGPTRPDLR